MNRIFTLRIWVVLLATVATLLPAQAQHRVTMAVPGTVANAFPFSGNVRKGQYLYAPADLANLRSGLIDTLFFRAHASPGSYTDNTLTNLKIGITQIPDAQFSSATFATVSDTVYRAASLTLPERGGGIWMAIPLQRTFAYDSTQSLVIEVSFTQNSVLGRGFTAKAATAKRVVLNTGNTVPQLQNNQSDLQFNVLPGPVSARTRLRNRLLVYPSPAREAVQIDLPVGTSPVMQVTLFSANGSAHTLPVQQRDNILTVPIANLPAGLYRLVLNLPEGMFYSSVVKE